MSESPLDDELPNDELRALVATEKSALVEPGADVAARLAARLGPLLIPPGAPTSPPAPTRPSGDPPGTPPRTPPGAPEAPPVTPPVAAASGLAGWKLLAAGVGTFLLGGATGAAIHATAAPPRTEVRYVDRIVEAPRSSDVPPPPTTTARIPTAEVQSLPSAASRPTANPSTTAAGTDQALAHERQIIEKARSALTRGDAEGAIAATDEHAAAFPKGQLGEAREAIAVQALARAGRGADARRRAERFHRDFPGSMYGPVVDAAVASIP